MDDMAEARAIDRALDAATDPAEMARLIGRRRLVRAGLELDQVVERIRTDADPGPIEPAFRTIEEWRALGRI